MRVALTGLSGRRRPTNSPRKSRLAAISLGHKQPKTHLEVGTKKPGRSTAINSLTHRGLKTPSGHATACLTFPPSPIRILRYDSASDELTRLGHRSINSTMQYVGT